MGQFVLLLVLLCEVMLGVRIDRIIREDGGPNHRRTEGVCCEDILEHASVDKVQRNYRQHINVQEIM